MICKDIIEKIEAAYPKRYAMEWDNVGLLVGRRDKEVKKIYVALDLTDEVLEDALFYGADMIVTHHPLIFTPLRSVTDESFIGRRVLKLLRQDISYYAMHTNYDILRMAELSAEMVGLQNVSVLDTVFEEEQKGVGCIGDDDEGMTLGECCQMVKEQFRLPAVKVFGEPKQIVQKIAICPGSGKSVIKKAIQKGADVLITGDIDHHEGIDSVACGMAIVDAGHYGLEHIYIADMKVFLERELAGVEIGAAGVSHPFQIC